MWKYSEPSSCVWREGLSTSRKYTWVVVGNDAATSSGTKLYASRDAAAVTHTDTVVCASAMHRHINRVCDCVQRVLVALCDGVRNALLNLCVCRVHRDPVRLLRLGVRARLAVIQRLQTPRRRRHRTLLGCPDIQRCHDTTPRRACGRSAEKTSASTSIACMFSSTNLQTIS